MRALVWRRPRHLEVEEVAEPSPRAGTALLGVAAAAVCGSDVTGYIGAMGNRVLCPRSRLIGLQLPGGFAERLVAPACPTPRPPCR
jgi:D-arabinose 1-dehydrogenase-like Zn-dependent alcohol dehydrogenase